MHSSTISSRRTICDLGTIDDMSMRPSNDPPRTRSHRTSEPNNAASLVDKRVRRPRGGSATDATLTIGVDALTRGLVPQPCVRDAGGEISGRGPTHGKQRQPALPGVGGFEHGFAVSSDHDFDYRIYGVHGVGIRQSTLSRRAAPRADGLQSLDTPNTQVPNDVHKRSQAH
jgi:hypothetical protein